MTEQFNGVEKLKSFSVEDVKKLQDLLIKVQEVVSWDLYSMCGSSEDGDYVVESKRAMKEVGKMFGIQTERLWEKEDPKPVLPKTISSNEIQKIRLDLTAIEEVLAWDIDAGDDEGFNFLREAREALRELKKIV